MFFYSGDNSFFFYDNIVVDNICKVYNSPAPVTLITHTDITQVQLASLRLLSIVIITVIIQISDPDWCVFIRLYRNLDAILTYLFAEPQIISDQYF